MEGKITREVYKNRAGYEVGPFVNIEITKNDDKKNSAEKEIVREGFPGGSVVKNPMANAGDRFYP